MERLVRIYAGENGIHPEVILDPVQLGEDSQTAFIQMGNASFIFSQVTLEEQVAHPPALQTPDWQMEKSVFFNHSRQAAPHLHLGDIFP